MEDRCEAEGEDRAGSAQGAGERGGLAQRYEVLPNQIYYARKKQLLDQAPRAFETGPGDGSGDRDKEIEQLHAKIGRLIVERDFLAKRPGR